VTRGSASDPFSARPFYRSFFRHRGGLGTEFQISTFTIVHRDEEQAMKKFLVLYMVNASAMAEMMKNSSPEDRKTGTEKWIRWMSDNKASFVDGGAPVGKTKRVDAKGASDMKNDVGGYSIVHANSADAAAKLFGKDAPHLQMPGSWVEISEIMPMPSA
jgi:hypothetical protein